MTQIPVVDYYRDEMADARNHKERNAIWRRYAKLLLDELADRRRIGGPVLLLSFKASSLDPVYRRFKPYWRRQTDAMLRDLWIALERAKMKAEPDS